ncbi:MAG: APC family permease [Pseudomonadota bacterium]
MTQTKRTHTPSVPAPLKRRLGLGLLTFYGVGVMIGAGIYVLIGEVAGRAGSWTPHAFLLAGLAAAVTAASFAELSGRVPEAGGSAAFARAAFPVAGVSVLVGLAVVATGVLSAGAVLQGGIGYLRALVDAPPALLVIAVGLVLTGLAIRGVVESLTAAAILTVIEVVGLMIIVAVAFLADPLDVSSPAADAVGAASTPAFGFGALAGAVFLAFFAFIGFEDIANMAEETKEPSRTVPLAILLAFAAVLAIYVLVAVAALRVVPAEALSQSPRPLALVYETATGSPPTFIAAIGVAASLNGVLAQIVMAARVLFSLGRRNRALKVLATTHQSWRTPIVATALCGGVVIVLGVMVPLAGLASATSLVLLSVFVLMNLALIRLKRQGPPPPGALDLPSWVPYLGTISSVAVIAGALL